MKKRISEMDKSQGSRRDFDNARGPDKTGKAIPVKKMKQDAKQALDKAFKGKVDEGIGSTLFGDHPVAALKGMFTGKGTRATLEQDIFIKDFVGDAIASLDNGVRGGLVDPTIRGGTTAAGQQDQEEPEQQPGQQRPTPASVAGSRPPSAPPGSPRGPGFTGSSGSAPAPTPGGTPPSPTTGGARPTNISGQFTQKGTAPQQTTRATASNVKFNMPGAKPAAGTAAATPTKPQAEQNWEASLRKQGYSDAEIERARPMYQARQNRQMPQAGGTTLSAARPANKPGDYKWARGIGPNTKLSDVGTVGQPASAAPAAPAVPQAEQDWEARMKKQGLTPDEIERARGPYRARQKTVKESIRYQRLNAIFESIMEANGGQSIAKYMEGWFNKYMGGVDWQTHGTQLQSLIQNIEDTYRKDKGKSAIKKLAQAAYAVAKASGTTPEGAKDAEEKQAGTGGQSQAAGQAAKAPGQAATAATAPAQTAVSLRDIQAALPNMELKELETLKKMVDAVISAKQEPAQQSQQQTQYMDKAAPSARPATKAANPLAAPTVPAGKTVNTTVSGGGRPGGITTGGASFTRESRNPRR